MALFSLIKKSPDSLRPITKKPRHRCPFYGFHYAGLPNILVDSMGNQCALCLGSYSLCEMETFKKEKPDWDKCSRNTGEHGDILKEAIASSRVFPDEFRPLSKAKILKPRWVGIPFKEWFDYVMRDKSERPQ
jgi:hypothetical protein